MRSKVMFVAAFALLAAVVPGGAFAQRSGVPDGVAVVGSIHGRGVAGPGSYAVLIDIHEMPKAKAKPTRAANCSNAGAESGTYGLTGWKIGGNRVAHLSTATVPSSLGSVTSTLEASWDVWSAAEPAAPSVNVATDGTVTRYTANRSYDILWGRTGRSLATTYTWRWSDGTIESDVVFDKGVTWWKAPSEGDGCYETAGNVYDVANIATHEFGHAYGLDHPSGARFETMYAYGYSGETLKRSLATGDVAGVRANY
ncbi:MAG: matrixin family metalloprotease [Actinobacteria bacterium]|nr:matrixin family metalloprotease [Actinomycetota bacterium]